MQLMTPGYEVTELIHEGLNSIIYRGVSTRQQAVILKVLKAEYPSLDQVARLKYEYSIIEGLDLPAIVKPISLENYQNRFVLVLEDFGGVSLKDYLQHRELSLVSFLSIAVQLAEALLSLHQHQIIHKDVKPANIIINPQTGQVKLTDFSIASRLDKETPQIVDPNQLEGTLAYISPEQTGRMNRSLDYRTDFYSLGVTFYEMLTGKLPFPSTDVLELIYSHIAKAPLIDQTHVPPMLAAIISKLMAKNAEDRYQSAYGLLKDLQRCLDEVKSTGQISEFVVGESDRTAQLLIPEKLYGREEEVKTLLAAFERVTHPENTSKSELVLVAGYSGIGKSSLVYEIHKPIVRCRGFFISGKFDQFQRAVPYAAFIQAFKSLIQQLLTLSATELEVWRNKLQTALGVNGQLIIDIIPELELIIGSQAPVAVVGVTEAQNRFNQVFLAFVRVFTQFEHPLVIFIDDLQWADIASLNLMQLLLTDNAEYLLMIGAYRDSEVSPAHPLMQTVEKIETATRVNYITVKPLTLSSVQQLISDALHEPSKNHEELASLLFNTTSGNPFFLTQMLKTLYQEGLLRFDFALGCWKWDLTQIESVGITNLGVVELMASNIGKLPAATQSVLQLAACIGARFKLNILAAVSNTSFDEILGTLWAALEKGFILPLGNTYKLSSLITSHEGEGNKWELEFKFLHDRVQQAAYSLIPDDQKAATHLNVGNLLLQTSADNLEEYLLDIVNHLNIAIDLLTLPSEKQELINLNLQASQKAKAANAYDAAVNYLNFALQLLDENSWQTDYNLTFKLYIELAFAEFLNTNYQRALDISQIALNQATNIFDKTKAYEVQIRTYTSLQQFETAIESGINALDALEVKLVDSIPQFDFQQLENLPEIQDLHQVAALQILVAIFYPAFLIDPNLYIKIGYTMADISIRYGNSAYAAYAYACCSIICSAAGQIELSYQYSYLSIKILGKFNNDNFDAKVLLVYHGLIRQSKEHIKSTFSPLVNTINKAIEIGDIEHVCITTMYLCIYKFFSGEGLSIVNENYKHYLEFIQKYKQNNTTQFINIFYQLILNLKSGNQICSLVGEVFNEDILVPFFIDNNLSAFLFGVYFCKLIIAYLFASYEQAVANAELAGKNTVAVVASAMIPQHNFYYSLALLARYPDVSVEEQKLYLSQVDLNQEKMKVWAFHCPSNYQNKYELVSAEKSRILGEHWEAIQLYDSAIKNASENEFVQEEALASELAGEFYLALGKTKIAKVYLSDAYYAYQRWGANAKVKQLESRYDFLTRIISQTISQTTNTKTKNEIAISTLNITNTSTTYKSSSSFDLATVIKVYQTLSSEIAIDKLLIKLMQLLREYAGAQKAYFLTNKYNLTQQNIYREELFVEAALDADSHEARVLESIPLTECNKLPISLIYYVQRTGKYLILDDANNSGALQFTQNTNCHSESSEESLNLNCHSEGSEESLIPQNLQDASQSEAKFNMTIRDDANNSKLFNTDFYIQQYQPLSVLVFPVVHKSELVGILYLENNITKGAFTINHIELLNLIAAQTAISLENARFYITLEQKVEERTQELRQTQLKLIQTEKMSSLGQLVAGIAHEINNPINFILGNIIYTHESTQSLLDLVEAYQQHYPDFVLPVELEANEVDLAFIREDLPKAFVSMKNGVARVKEIVLSLRNFARLDEADYKQADIHEGLNNTLMILNKKLEAIQVIKEYSNIPKIFCFAGELNQVFMHILSNAIDAVAHVDTPVIQINTEIRNDNQIAIRITDNGKGISNEIKEKIFDPFFTTKPVGQGTGLGLSISHQIIMQHSGQLIFTSQPGVGTQFTILLPCSSDIAH